MIDGCETLMHTQRGSRPGDTHADLCFSFALAKILQGFEQTVIEEFPDLKTSWDGVKCLCASTVTSERLSVVMPIWADDLATAMHAERPEELLAMVRRISGLLFDRFALAGLQPNLQAGKTEVLLDMKGHGTIAQRRALLAQGNVMMTDSALVKEPLRVVPTYKHLGTWIQVGAKMVMDVRVRFAVAQDTLTKYRKQIFSNSGMALDTKMQYMDSLVFSALLFHAAVWVPKAKREWQSLERGHNKPCKRLAMMHFGHGAQTWDACRVRAALGVLTCNDLLQEARLRFCHQLICKGVPHLWALLQLEVTWGELLVQDIRWIQQLCPEAEVPSPEGDSWSQSALRLTGGRLSSARQSSGPSRTPNGVMGGRCGTRTS